MTERQADDDPLLQATTPSPVVSDVVDEVTGSGSLLKALSFQPGSRPTPTFVSRSEESGATRPPLTFRVEGEDSARNT